jgi:hypothetical protein
MTSHFFAKHFVSFSLVSCALAFALSAPSLIAQTETTGDVAGTVMDSSGAVVAGAAINLVFPATSETRTATSNDTGQFRFTFLHPGAYNLSASAPGLKTDISKVTVQIGQALNVTLVAKVQATRQTLEVSADTTLVNTETANLAADFSSKQVQELPAPGGDLTTVAFSVPGINQSTGMAYGNFSSHGLPGVSNLFTINGNDYNDPYLNLNNSGASNLLLGQNEIGEASVVQNAYSVQYGRQAGAQVNFVTKSGSNQIHGNLLYTYNDDSFNANTFFNNETGSPRPKSVSNQWGASIGGPVVKNKLFFFADAEGLRYILPFSGAVVVPSQQLQTYILDKLPAAQQSLYQKAFKLYDSAPGYSTSQPVTTGNGLLQDPSGSLGCGNYFSNTANGNPAVVAPNGGIFGQSVACANAWQANAPNLNTEWLSTVRGDWNISDKQKFYARYKVDQGVQATGTNLVNSAFNNNSVQPEYEGQINYTYVISPSMVNNFIGSALWYSALFGPSDPATSLAAFPTYFQINDGGVTGGGYYPLGVNWQFYPQGRNVGQLELIDDFSATKGSHTLKVGFNARRNRVSDHGLNVNTAGSYNFGSLGDFASGITDAALGSTYTQTFTSLDVAHIRFYNLGLYAQDEWNAKPNLKITYGLRVDKTGNPTCLEDCFSRLANGFETASADVPYNQSVETGLRHAYSSTEFANPEGRLGVVWSPVGGNGPVIRAGFGMFADLPPGFFVSSIFSNAPNPFGAVVNGGQDVNSVAANDPNSAPSLAQEEYSIFHTGFFHGATLAQLSSSVPGGAFGPPDVFVPPAELKSPKYLEWSFEIQQPLGRKNVFVATYSGNHGYDLFAQNGFANAGYGANGNFPRGFGGLPAASPDPRFNTATVLLNNGVSNYDGLSVQFKRALTYGFSGQLSYTWSHSLDYISNGGSGLPYAGTSFTALANPVLSQNYSNSDYDIRHSVQADLIWDTPWRTDNRFLRPLLGWTVASKFYFRTGTPFSVFDSQLAGEVSPAINGVITATEIASAAAHCGAGSVDTPCFTAADFVPTGTETGFGNLVRNAFRGPGYQDIDTSVYKNFTIRENIRLMLGASAYNLFNHPNFGNPNGNVASPSLGFIQNVVSPPTSPYGSFQGSGVSGRVLVLTGRFTF